MQTYHIDKVIESDIAMLAPILRFQPSIEHKPATQALNRIP